IAAWSQVALDPRADVPSIAAVAVLHTTERVLLLLIQDLLEILPVLLLNAIASLQNLGHRPRRPPTRELAPAKLDTAGNVVECIQKARLTGLVRADHGYNGWTEVQQLRRSETLVATDLN